MTDKPAPPPSFRRACGMFHVDIERMCPTLEEMAAFALRGMNESQRDTLAEYLDHLLSDDYTPDELKELWNSSGPDVFIPDVKNLIALFTAMRQQLRSTQSTKQPD